MQLIHGLCHLVYDEAGTLRPGMSGRIVRDAKELPDAEITLHAFQSPDMAAAFIAGVASSGANTASASQGLDGCDRLVLLRRDDRGPRNGSDLNDIVSVVDHGGGKGLRIRNAWDWLRQSTPYPSQRTNYNHPYIEATIPDDGSDPTLDLSGITHASDVVLRVGQSPDLVEAVMPSWSMASAFDGTWGVMDDLSKPTGNDRLDKLLAKYGVRLENGGKTFVAVLPKERFVENLTGIGELLDELWNLSYQREKAHEARRTRADPKHMAIVRKMKAGWRLEGWYGSANLIPPDGDVIQTRKVSGVMVDRLLNAGLIATPFERHGQNSKQAGFDYVLADRVPGSEPGSHGTAPRRRT